MGYFTAFVYTVGSIICHQIPERSFYLAGMQLPVCARCTGLYLGGLIGVAVWTAQRTRVMSFDAARIALAAAALPTFLTVLTAHLGWWDPSNMLRGVLAAPLGVVAGGVVSAGLTRNLR